MANFTALNIEPDDQSDDEVDNTKELQIEDALKTYQSALKLHAQAEYPLAHAAYSTLFESDVFKYPESITEFTRLDQNPQLEYSDPSLALDLELAAAADGGSSLPQILYLSYKNHGQFILDCVKGRLKHEPMRSLDLASQAKAAIDNFALALASDASDAELWRKTARIGSLLGSRRIARYCLEAAVELDDDPTIAEVEPPSLEEAFAGEQLREQLEVLSDDTSLSHPIMGPFVKKVMPQYLAKHTDPYPFLPAASKKLETDERTPDIIRTAKDRYILLSDARTWASVGVKLCEAFILPEGLSGRALILLLPSQPVQSTEQELISPSDPVEDQIMKDVGITDSPVIETGESTSVTPVVGESNVSSVAIVTTTTTVPLADVQGTSSVTLPTRKRSQSAAGLRETPDDDSGAQKRSKRIRDRDNTNDGAIDTSAQYAEQLQNFVRADEDVFAFVGGILTKLGVEDLGSLSELQAILAKEEDVNDRADAVANAAVRDLRDILRNWDNDKASAFVNANANDLLGSSVGSANAGLAAFLEHSKSGPLKISTIPPFSEDGLSAFAKRIQDGWMPLQDIIYEWVWIVLRTYQSTIWSETLKVTVVRTISFVDAEIFERVQLDMAAARDGGEKERLSQFEDFVQTLFELHIDVYSRITNPNSIISYETRIMTKDRLDRWAELCADIMGSRKVETSDEISLRYLWASVFYSTMADHVSREHKVLCWSDLQSILRDAGNGPIELQNNAVMPEISIDAAEREVSRLTTMEFFFNLFQADKSNPVAIIETLEPVLDPESACQPADTGVDDSVVSMSGYDGTRRALRDMWKFLKTGSTSLRLFLWQRLREAYLSIGYNTKVFSCHLKCIEIIVEDLRSNDYVDTEKVSREHKLLIWLKALDDLLVKALTIALNDAATCFEIIDERHLKSTCATLAQLNRILHSAALYDDEIRIPKTPLIPTVGSSANGSFNVFTNKLREMQVRTWALQYTMVKEAMSQNKEIFTKPDNDLADFLALVHYTLGLRKCCKSSNKIFLKMMKMEMLRLKQVDRWEDYLGQVLFDLYDLRLGVGTYMLEDHGCPSETLDKRTVLNIAEQIVLLANRMSMKDLLKHELRATIEKMQTAVGAATSNPQMQHNLRNYTEYLKTSLRPIHFMKAWGGQMQVDSVPVVTNDSALANIRWYFLLGMIALTKFRSQKRLGPGSQTDDLRVGATFLRLQLQFNADDWEAWYRLAQCYDFELEEEVMWSAEKINNNRADLVALQRGAIHCYVLALSTSIRTADDSFETAEKLSEMYHEFGMRIYASSREPFSMEAFWVDGFEKHMSGSQGMYKKPLHDEMTKYKAWSHAAKLFKKALVHKPSYWMNHYMVGKCLWKMYYHDGEDGRTNKPSMDSVLRAFVRAIQTCPKPRDGRQEPILEPHYKIVSIVYKLVSMGSLEPQPAVDLLQKQPYAIKKSEPVKIQRSEDWKDFILQYLRQLRNADKQHWQHRIIARVARLIYDPASPDYVTASEARLVLRESMFTKTMHIQVWKCEAERAGRHCVYMERYTRLMIHLLGLLNDKPNMEQLAKRIRKKAPDFHRFPVVWDECCLEYLKLLRRCASIQPGIDDVFRSVPSEEYEIYGARLSAWISDPNTARTPVLDVLRDTQELKRMNANQMKPTPIDDLINDIWATLYTQVAKSLPGDTVGIPQHDGSSNAPPPSRVVGPMSLNNLVKDMNGAPVQVPVTFAEPIRPRKIGVSRREVLRTAELAISRLPDVPRSIAPSSCRPRISEPPASMILGSNAGPQQEMQRNASASASATPRPDGHSTYGANDYGQGSEEAEDKDQGDNEADDEGDGDEERDGEGEEEKQRADAGEESERGSLHDSADDESDLSDVPDMDDIEEEAIFPNLVRSSND